MVTSNKDLMTQAREALSGRWGLAVGTFFLYIVIVGAIGLIPIAGSLITLLIGGALAFGVATFSLAIARKEDANVEMLFAGFKHFGKTLGLYLLQVLLVLLYALLLIVPGIIAAISYSLAFYIMVEDPNIGAMEALEKSKKMMYGYKWKYVCLCFRFLGWVLLCILTLGIGLLWLAPYSNISFAKFYEDVKANFVEGQ